MFLQIIYLDISKKMKKRESNSKSNIFLIIFFALSFIHKEIQMSGMLTLQPELMQSEQSLETFRAITDDQIISDSQIRTFLKWGNGKLEQALNYYYRKKQKQTKTPQIPSQASQSQNNNAFAKLGEGMMRQKKTQEFIAKIREDYLLPITTRNKSGIQSKDKRGDAKMEVMNAQDMMDAQFQEADYLPDIFSGKVETEEKDEIEQEGESYRESFGQEENGQRREVLEILAQESYEEAKREDQQIKRKKNIKNESLQQKSIEKSFQLKIKSQDRSSQKEIQKQQIIQPRTRQNIDKFKTKVTPKHSQNQQSPQSRFQMIEGQTQIYLGQTILRGFAIKFQNNLQIPEDTKMQFRYFMADQKKKKSAKGKKDLNMNMRIAYRGSQFGRLNDQQVRFVVPLIMHGMIRFQLRSLTIPRRIDYYTKVTFKGRFFLLKKAITQPVVQTFEGHSDLIVSVYKPVAEQLLGMLQRIQLPIKTWPLIKKKSKLKTKTQIQTKTESVASSKPLTELQAETKRLQAHQHRMRNDPFLKTVQRSLSDMMKFSKTQESDTASIKKDEDSMRLTLQKSGVKMRVVQLVQKDQERCNQLVDLFDEDLQPCQPSSNFVSQLYNYQALALSWMIRRQGDQHKSQQQQLHPLWTQYTLQDQRSIFVNQLTSQLSLRPPLSATKCLGGILADEMGLGKTVMMAALMASKTQKRSNKKQGGNLIVLPLTLLSQWQSQIKKHTKNLKTLTYYGADRVKGQKGMSDYQVVITTYGTLSHQYSKGQHISKTGLYRMKWQRIILDQAHYIKGRIIQTSKAAYELQGHFRWCLTGTPIQNGLTDLFSLIHFIKYSPWAQFECWNKYITKPQEAGDEDVFTVLRTILKKIFLRRTKQSKDPQGKSIVNLPPKDSKIQFLQMNQKQRQFYDKVYQSSRSQFDQLQKLGILQAKYMQVLEMLMRLRQICCHPILFKSVSKFDTNMQEFQASLKRFLAKRERERQKESGQQQAYFQPVIQQQQQSRVQITQTRISQTYIASTLKKIQKQQFQNCLICLNSMQDPVITACLHMFCHTCAIRQIQQCGICSACRRRINRDDIMHLPRQNRFNCQLRDNQQYFPSTKLVALGTHLRKMRPGDKAVVFSQFLGMLDLIQHHIELQKIPFLRMQGSTSHKDRTLILQKFQKDPSIQVFIVSLKTGGVGLNLVAANKVFLMDPWWNPGVQQQAIERVHRIGQKREVEVVRFVMEQSIETRMLQLNTSKKELSMRVMSQQGLPQVESRVAKLKYLMEKY